MEEIEQLAVFIIDQEATQRLHQGIAQKDLQLAEHGGSDDLSLILDTDIFGMKAAFFSDMRHLRGLPEAAQRMGIREGGEFLFAQCGEFHVKHSFARSETSIAQKEKIEICFCAPSALCISLKELLVGIVVYYYTVFAAAADMRQSGLSGR